MDSSRDARESTVTFGDFSLDTGSRRLTRAGADIHLTPKAYDLLLVLLTARPRALSKAELHRCVWPSTHVSEATLTALIGELREAIGETSSKDGFIRTVPRFGYAWGGHASGPAPTKAATAGPPPDVPGAVASTAPRPRRPVWAASRIAALAITALIAVAAGAGIWLWPRPSSTPPVTAGGLDPEKVVVAAFVNQTGDASLDALGIQIADWATQSLSRIQARVAINPELPMFGRPGQPRSVTEAGRDPIRALAERTGAGLVLTGAYYLDGATLRAQSQIIDAASGAIAVSFNPTVSPRSTPSDLAAGVAQMAMSAMAARQPPSRSGNLPPGTRPPPYDAYLEGSLGWSATTNNMAEAERHFRRSLQMDPGFTLARIGLCYTVWAVGRMTEADDCVRVLEDPAAYGQASPFEQAGIRTARAGIDGNLRAYLAGHTEVARLWPHPFNIYTQSLREHDVGRPRAALETLSRIRMTDVPADGGPVPPSSFAFRAVLHHELGEYDMQLNVARLGQQHFPSPGNTGFFAQEIGALVALGRMVEVDAVITRAAQATMTTDGTGNLLMHAARELAAHDHATEARSTAIRAAEWFKSHLATRKPTTDLRDAYATALMRAGDCRQALAIYRDLSRVSPDDRSYCAWQASYAVALVQCGPRDEAQKIAVALEQADRPFRRGEHLFQRARVLAALGDAEGAVRALQAAFAKGAPWSAMRLHLDVSWDPIRHSQPFLEWMKPRE